MRREEGKGGREEKGKGRIRDCPLSEILNTPLLYTRYLKV